MSVSSDYQPSGYQSSRSLESFYTAEQSPSPDQLEEVTRDYFDQLPSDKEALKTKLQSSDNLYVIAKQALEWLSTGEFGEQANEIFECVIDTCLEISTHMTDGQQAEWEVLYQTHKGIPAGDAIPEAFDKRLTDFLGDAQQIDAIDSVDQAKDIAFRLFAGARHIESPQSRYLLHVVHVAQDSDIPLLQQMMKKLRDVQKIYFTTHGFLGRSKHVTIQSVGESEDVETVSVPGGRRSIHSYLNQETDGRFLFGSHLPGMVVYKDASQEVLTARAIELAKHNYDDPVIQRISVVAKNLYSDSEGSVRLYVDSDCEPRIDHVDVCVMPSDPLSVASIEGVYTELTAAQRLRLEKLLFNSDPPVEGGAQEASQWKYRLQVVAALIGCVILYKYFIQPYLHNHGRSSQTPKTS